MLNKEEIIFYTEENYMKDLKKDYTLKVGMTHTESIEASRMVEILPLKQQSDGNKNDWVIDGDTERVRNIGKNNIFYIIKNKQILGELGEGNYLISIDGKSVEKIFKKWNLFLKNSENLNSDKKNEKIGGKMLRKRRKGKKSQPEESEDETDFETFLARSKYKIGRERQLEILPSFRKIASTNLRFGKEKDENGDIFLDFGTSRKKKIRKKRKLSLGVIQEEEELDLGFTKKSLTKDKKSGKVHFVEYLKQYIFEEKSKFDESKKTKTSNLMLEESEGDFLISKFNYLNLTSENVYGFYEELRKLEEGIMDVKIENLIDLNNKLIFSVVDYSVRLVLTFSMVELHRIREDLYMKNPEVSSVFKLEGLSKIAKKTKKIYRGIFILENLLDFIEKISKNLNEEFHVEYFEFIQKFCFLIINNLDRVSKAETKRDHKKNHLIKIQIKIADFNFRLFSSLFKFKGTEKIQLNILSLIISQIRTTSSFSIQGSQPLIAKRLNKFYNDKLNQTPKKWNIFVDSCVDVITKKGKEFSFEDFFKDAQKMEYFTGIMLSIQTSLAKGYYTGLMRVVIQRYIQKGDFSDLKKQPKKEVSGMEEEDDDLTLECFMLDLLSSTEKLPVFVYFARCLQHYYGDLKKIACKHEISPLEVFTQRYMTEDEEVQLEDFKYIPLEYRQYVDGKKRLNYILQANKQTEFIELVKKNLSDFSTGKKIGEKESCLVEKYNFWLILLNEFYTAYLVNQPVNFRDRFKEKIPEIQKMVEESKKADVSERHFKLMKLLVNNFEGNHYLSLKPKDSKETARIKITIVHTLIILSLTKNEFLGLFTNEKSPYFKRGQLAAYPSKKEINLLLIANTFNNLSGEWRTGQQFTRLYRCSCSYLYWIGDCGRAWVIAKCPNCKMDIGGEKHKLVNSEKGGKEITKDIFFNSMYTPLERKSDRIYHLRSFGGKYEKIEGEYEMEVGEEEPIEDENIVDLFMQVEDPKDKKSSEDEEEVNEEEDGMEPKPHKPENAIFEEKFEVEVGKAFTPLRGMDKISIFSISEFLGHVRYLLEELVSSDEVKKEQAKFFGIDIEKYKVESYLFEVLARDYERIGADEWKSFNPEQFFRALNILIESSIGENLNKKSQYDRNDIEKMIRNEYEDKKDQIADYVVQRIQLKKNFDKTMSGTTKLTKDWMSNLVALDDFKGTEIDLKLVSGMRMKAVANLEKFKDWLKIHIHRENTSQDMITRMNFVKRVIELQEILSILKFLIGSHIEFCQLIKAEFEHRLSYKQACSLSIEELVEGKVSKDTPNEKLKQIKEHLIKTFQRKNELIDSYSKLVEAWKEIMNYREEYADLFNFRFLCHAQELPEEKIDLIFNPKTAKLIYFIPSGKYVESLFMSSAIPTLSQIQNDFLKNSSEDYFRANFRKPPKISCLKIDTKTHLISMEKDLDFYLKNFTYTDLAFNKDFQVVYDIDLMAKEMSKDIMKNACILASEGEHAMDFKFGREFSSIYEKIKELEIKKSWKWSLLDKERSEYWEKLLSEYGENELFEFYSVLAKKIDWFYDENDGISEEDNQKYEELEIINEEIKEIYHILEKHSVKKLLEDPLPQLKLPLGETESEDLSQFYKTLNKISKEKFKKMSISLYLTRIIGTTNENIGNISIKDCMQWSDILTEPENEDLDFLDSFDNNLNMKQLYGILKVILK